jgi:hypothetical protein
MRTRYVITMLDKSGFRCLACTNWAQYHHDRKADAEKMLKAMLANNSADTLRSVYGDVTKMKVMPAECYDHGECTGTHGFGYEGDDPLLKEIFDNKERDPLPRKPAARRYRRGHAPHPV